MKPFVAVIPLLVTHNHKVTTAGLLAETPWAEWVIIFCLLELMHPAAWQGKNWASLAVKLEDFRITPK